jgi:hypothetical protein
MDTNAAEDLSLTNSSKTLRQSLLDLLLKYAEKAKSITKVTFSILVYLHREDGVWYVSAPARPYAAAKCSG